jgi:hypothetical protein
MLLGENEQLKVLGRPLHESASGVFRVPDFIAAVIVAVPDSPEGILTALGETLKEIVAGGGGGGGALETVPAQVGL